MKLEVHAGDLTHIGKYLEQSSGRVDILHMVTQEKEGLFATTASPENRLSMAIGAKVEEEGSAIVSIRKLMALARSVGEGIKLSIESEGTDTLGVKDGSFSARLPLLPSDLYTQPRVLADGYELIGLDSASFKKAMAACGQTVGNEDGGWVGCFYVETGKTDGVIVTSDRAQITSMRFRLREPTGKEAPVKMSLPAGFVQTMIGVSGEELSMATDGRMVRFRCKEYLADYALGVKLMPAISPVILKGMEEIRAKAILPVDSLINALGVAGQIVEGSSKAYAWLDLSEAEQRLRVNGDRVDEFSVRFAGSSTGTVRYHFDARRFGAALRNLKNLGLVKDGVEMLFGTDERMPTLLPLSEDKQDFYALSPQMVHGGGK